MGLLVIEGEDHRPYQHKYDGGGVAIKHLRMTAYL